VTIVAVPDLALWDRHSGLRQQRTTVEAFPELIGILSFSIDPLKISDSRLIHD
jgi:hypothetical protein